MYKCSNFDHVHPHLHCGAVHDAGQGGVHVVSGGNEVHLTFCAASPIVMLNPPIPRVMHLGKTNVKDKTSMQDKVTENAKSE